MQESNEKFPGNCLDGCIPQQGQIQMPDKHCATVFAMITLFQVSKAAHLQPVTEIAITAEHAQKQ